MSGCFPGISQSRISHWLLQHGSDLSEQKKRAFYRWYTLEKTTPGTSIPCLAACSWLSVCVWSQGMWLKMEAKFGRASERDPHPSRMVRYAAGAERKLQNETLSEHNMNVWILRGQSAAALSVTSSRSLKKGVSFSQSECSCKVPVEQMKKSWWVWSLNVKRAVEFAWLIAAGKQLQRKEAWWENTLLPAVSC